MSLPMTRSSVAAGVPPAVEGGVSPPGVPGSSSQYVSKSLVLLSLLGALLPVQVRAADPGTDGVLFDAASGLVETRWNRTDASLRLKSAEGRAAVEIRTGVAVTWPGAGLASPAGGWDLRRRSAVDVELRNPGTNLVKVFCRVDNPGADGRRHCVTADKTLAPGTDGVLRVALARHAMEKPAGDLFGMRGYPMVAGGDWTVDPGNITQVLLFVSQPTAPQVFEILRIRAVGDYVPPTANWTDAQPFAPFIDAFGQYRHQDWPGKVHSVEELKARRETEAQDLEQRPGPAGWNAYGGWAAGPRLSATGFFRVQKHEGRWWLVDPEGCLFWSHGVDCVRSLDFSPVEERQHWFADFPGDAPEFISFWTTGGYALKGHYAGRSPRSFSFAGANFRRKYGPDWKGAYGELVHRRLRSWGMNTIANWSAMDVAALRKTPYTDSLESGGAPRIAGSDGYWGKFPDVFDERFVAGLRRGMSGKVGRSAGDPWCLGYFSDNEMSWGDETSLSEATLRSPADQPAKRAFAAFLRERHGEITALNAAWGTAHASWEAWLESRTLPDRGRAGGDLAGFYSRVADTYFAAVRRVIREVAPNQLYLGCRFAWVNERAAAAAAKHCDVVSYNLYQRTVGDFVFNGGADVPLIIGEFHFGALERGMFHTGLVPVADQKARAIAYRDYVESALRHPQFVGTHWFQWQDEPTTGRVYDEENYQIGLVDIADTPYAETIEAVRGVGQGLYELRRNHPKR
jgi:hypothetical protein